MMGASEVLASWAGWLMVSASNTTSCRDLASSNMRSISLCTSAKEEEALTGGSAHCLTRGFEGGLLRGGEEGPDGLGGQRTVQTRTVLGALEGGGMGKKGRRSD